MIIYSVEVRGTEVLTAVRQGSVHAELSGKALALAMSNFFVEMEKKWVFLPILVL